MRKGKCYVGCLKQTGEYEQRGGEVLLQCRSANRITEWLRLAGTSGGCLVQPFCAGRATYSRLWPRTMSRRLLNIQGWRLHSLTEQPVPVLGHPHSKIAFPDVHREPRVFQFVLIASGSVTGHHWKKPVSLCFAPPHQVFIPMNKIPLSLLFSRLNSPSSLGLSS